MLNYKNMDKKNIFYCHTPGKLCTAYAYYNNNVTDFTQDQFMDYLRLELVTRNHAKLLEHYDVRFNEKNASFLEHCDDNSMHNVSIHCEDIERVDLYELCVLILQQNNDVLSDLICRFKFKRISLHVFDKRYIYIISNIRLFVEKLTNALYSPCVLNKKYVCTTITGVDAELGDEKATFITKIGKRNVIVGLSNLWYISEDEVYECIINA